MSSPGESSWLKTMQQGQQCFQQGNFSEAIQFFSRARKIAPQRTESWVNLGVAQNEAGAYSDAVATLQHAISLNSNIVPAYLALGDANRLLGNIEAAFTAYQTALRLQRNPITLNKVASLLRVIGQASKSEALYHEALQIAPDFTLAKVNLATLQIDLNRFEDAKKQLSILQELPLPSAESSEVNSTDTALNQYFHLQPAIEHASKNGDLSVLKESLQSNPNEMLKEDEEILDGIRAYAESAQKLILPERNDPVELPNDWPLIEALFMVPLVETVAEYQKIRQDLKSTTMQKTAEQLASTNMERVVLAAQNDFTDFLVSPINAELHIRYWHLLATTNIEGMVPGQFKIIRNQTGEDPNKRRAEPHLSTGTFRRFFNEIYLALPPGMGRGIVAMMAMSDIHPFPDGNGRMALTWLNRELEFVGQYPALFTDEMGFKGELGKAITEFRYHTDDISALVELVSEAQQFSQDFCIELSQLENKCFD